MMPAATTSTMSARCPLCGEAVLDVSADGRVMASELVADNPAIRVTIDVGYRADPTLGFLVPGEMRERLENLTDGTVITGSAEYGKFRRFQVSVDEKIWLDAKP